MESVWIIWAILFAASIALETVSMQLFSIWFALGALTAGAAVFFGAEPWLQIVLFVGVTALSLLASRPLVKRLQKKVEPTNADRMVGKNAVVLEEINNINGTGQIQVDGQVWSARTEEDEILLVGTNVRTIAIRGVKMIVTHTQPAEEKGE
ncbi:MAG: NfeD family protein [Oscillospiraceae bacterium]|jgi:membrane protein implicated in regulation of membrane protease activity|nr:NfeD family protein [Oscillospiraceae bacterium]